MSAPLGRCPEEAGGWADATRMIPRGSAFCSGVRSIFVELEPTEEVGVSHDPVMKVANLSVNGKKHWPTVCAWLRATCPDIVTLQKVGPEEHFPARHLRDIGYEIEGLPSRSKSDPGIAILTHDELHKQEECVRQLPDAEPGESRLLAAARSPPSSRQQRLASGRPS